MTIVCSHFDSGVELLQRQCKISADKITQLENELKFTKESHEQLKIQLDTGYSITDSHRDDSIVCSGDYPSNVADDISQTSCSWTEVHEDPLDDPWRNISSPTRGSPLSPLAICSDRDSNHSDFKSFRSICTCQLSSCGGLICDGSDTNHTNTSSIPRLWGENEAIMGTRLIESSLIECDAEGDVRENKRGHSHSHSICQTCAFCSEYGDCVHRYLESNMDKSNSFLHDMLSQLTSDLADRTVEAQSLSTTNIVLEARIIELQAELQHSPFTPGKISGELFKECSRLRWRIVELEKGFSAQQKNIQMKEKEEKEEEEAAAAAAAANAMALRPTISCSTDTLTTGVIGAGVEMPFSVMASTRKRGYNLRKSISDLQCSSAPYCPSPSPTPSFSPSPSFPLSPSLSPSLSLSLSPTTTPSYCMAHSPSSTGPSVSLSCSSSSPGPTLLQKIFKNESESESGGSISQSQPYDRNSSNNNNHSSSSSSSNNSNNNNNNNNSSNNKKKQYAAFQDCVKSPTSVLDIVSMIEQEHEVRESKLKLKVNAEDDKMEYRKARFRDGIMETIDYKEKIALKLEIEKKEKERMLADEMHYYQLQRLMGKVSELMGIHDRKEEGFRVLIEGLEEQLMAATNALCIAQDSIQTQTESQKVKALEYESPDQRDYSQSNHHMRKGYDNAASSVQEDAVIERDIGELEEDEEEVEAGLRLASTLMTVSTASIKEISDHRKQKSNDTDMKRTINRERDRDRDRDNKGDGEQKSEGSADGTYDSLHGDSNSRISAIHSNTYLSSLLYMELGKSESPSHTLLNHSHSHSHSHCHSLGGAGEDIVTESSLSSSLPSCMTSPATSPISASPAEHYHHHHHHSDNDGDDEGGNETVCGRIRWKNDNSDPHLHTADTSCHLEILRKRVALRGRVSHDRDEIGYTQ